MKIPTVLFAITAVVLVPALRAAGRPEHEDRKQTELGSHMEKIGHAFRRLSREVADPSKHDDAIKQVAIIRDNAEASLNFKPAKAADVPEADRAAFVAGFREKMKSFIADIGRLDAALKADDTRGAVELVKVLKDDMDQGHKKYRKKMRRRL